jgi:hypothetical protein
MTFDIELKEYHDRAVVAMVDMIARAPAEFAKRIGVPVDEAIAASTALNAGTLAQRNRLLALLRSPMIETLYPRLKIEREALDTQRSAVVAQFRNSGIFCATRSKSNLLMWSHYADQHRGAVLGFHPDGTRDSWLCQLEPVNYSDVRPRFFSASDPLLADMPPSTPEEMREFTLGR